MINKYIKIFTNRLFHSKRMFLFAIPFLFLNCSNQKNNNQNVLAGLLLISSTGYNWNLPIGFPVPLVPGENPMSEAKVNLGRFLFYDKSLSGNGTQSCASCHIQALAFSDGRALGLGSTGELHPRSPQHLSNVAYATKLTWNNPNQTNLEIQSRAPLFGTTPIELGLSGDQYLTVLKSNSRYTELFEKAFGSGDHINEQNLRFALASFQRSLISGNSPFDKFVYQGKTDSLSASAIRGMNIFNGEVAECFHCHGGVNFTDTTTHSNSASQEFFYHDNGNKSLTEYSVLADNQKGLFEITGKTTDIGKFKAPSLRNIALTYPYMHDGSIDCSPINKGTIGVYSDACATEALGRVIDHYMRGGKTPSNKDTAFIRPFSLTPGERTDLINFLKSLTDEDFIKNTKFSNPF